MVAANKHKIHLSIHRGTRCQFVKSYSAPGGNQGYVGGRSQGWSNRGRYRTEPARHG